MITSALRIFLGSLIFAAVSVLASESPRERVVSNSIHKLLCEKKVTPDDLLKDGIFDAQINVVSLEPKAGQRKLTTSDLQRRAVILARDAEQGSIAYGVCDTGGGWVMALPARAPLEVKRIGRENGDENKLLITKDVTEQCANGTLKAVFAQEQKGRSLSLKLSPQAGAVMTILPAQKGYASVTCVLKEYPDSGPRELYLVPVWGAISDPAELGRSLLKSRDPSIESWANQMRVYEKLPPLQPHPSLTSAAYALISKGHLRHDLNALRTTRESLAMRGVEGIGENRIKGATLYDIVGLIWMSPLHRDLILNPAAEAIGVATSRQADGILAVIVSGKSMILSPNARL